MAETIQSISKRYYTTSSSNSIHPEKPKTENNISLMFSVCDSLNDLCINLEKLDHALKMKNIELRINLKEKEQSSPQAESSD